uniref:LRRCT domain-containing protein n=1 Tax=Nothoprocta perdicaria TaxID=30464 RepID=A0A8C6ZN65_NOTPE
NHRQPWPHNRMEPPGFGQITASATPGAEFPQPCPKVCLCKEEARFVNCSGVSLSGSLIFPLETEHLDLSNSGLHAMPSLALRSLWKLQVLLLCGNDIAEVERGAFQSLERLQKLDISGNMITVLGSSFSAGLSSLLELSLSHNRIQAARFRSFQNFENLFKTFLTLQTAGTHILLSDNPWFCDCDLQRVFSKLHSVRRLVLDRYENITCTEPAVLRNIPLASVDTQLCAAEMATVLIITITALVSVVAAIVMAERNRRRRTGKHWSEDNELSYSIHW